LQFCSFTLFLPYSRLRQTNVRTDEYSSHPKNVLRLLHRIISSIRSVVPKTFIVGIKINAGDYVNSNVSRDEGFSRTLGNAEDERDTRALDHVYTIASWGGVDFIEISGGDYENPGGPFCFHVFYLCRRKSMNRIYGFDQTIFQIAAAGLLYGIVPSRYESPFMPLVEFFVLFIHPFDSPYRRSPNPRATAHGSVFTPRPPFGHRQRINLVSRLA
jgi:hypothetical protein